MTALIHLSMAAWCEVDYIYYYSMMISRFWPTIDNKLRKIAFESKNVTIKLLASCWDHTIPEMLNYLRSLDAFSDRIEVVGFVGFPLVF